MTDTPLGRHPQGRHPSGQTATAADGTHPTGMRSCFFKNQNSLGSQGYPFLRASLCTAGLDKAFSAANSTIESKKVKLDKTLKALADEKDQALLNIDSTFDQHTHTIQRRATLLKNKVHKHNTYISYRGPPCWKGELVAHRSNRKRAA